MGHAVQDLGDERLVLDPAALRTGLQRLKIPLTLLSFRLLDDDSKFQKTREMRVAIHDVTALHPENPDLFRGDIHRVDDAVPSKPKSPEQIHGPPERGPDQMRGLRESVVGRLRQRLNRPAGDSGEIALHRGMPHDLVGRWVYFRLPRRPLFHWSS